MDLDVFRQRIGELLDSARRRLTLAERQPEDDTWFEGMIGRAPVVNGMFSRIRRVNLS